MTALVVRPRAEADLDEAFAWYESRSVGLGVDFLRAVDACFAAIEAAPLAYPVVYRAARRALLRRLRCADFADLAPIAEAMRAVDACLFCLGTSVRNVATEAEYREIHVHYALAAARALPARSPHATFVYLSGAGTNRRSRMMWARVKAEAEDQLASLGLARLVCVRPGGIPPAQLSGFDRWVVAPLLKALPSLGIEADALGRAMLETVFNRPEPARVVLEKRALQALAATPNAASAPSVRAV